MLRHLKVQFIISITNPTLVDEIRLPCTSLYMLKKFELLMVSPYIPMLLINPPVLYALKLLQLQLLRLMVNELL